MDRMYVPYNGQEPVSILVNGHRMVMVAFDEQAFDNSTSFDKVEYLVEVDGVDSLPELEAIVGELATDEASGVVIVPRDVPVDTVILNLHSELPWVH